MNAAITLADRFTRRDGDVMLTGVQALVRLMLEQAASDRAHGRRTGGFVSGYRGSPLGGLDMAFAGAAKQVDEAGIVVRPAVNEELAATAVAGSQQIEQTPGARVDGIFSLWYGKGPGLDRASDAIRHGNFQGSSPLGGVVVAVGDDHIAKSSSIVCYSDEVVAGLQIPLLYPADAAEIVTYGLHGFAMSRHSGSWAALKIITDVADATRTVDASGFRIQLDLPAIDVPAGGLHNRWPEMPLEQEARQQNCRLPAIHAYVRANALDQQVGRDDRSRIGIVAAGKTWLDLQEALRLLGLAEDDLRRLGIALYKPALIWPLEPRQLREFAGTLQDLVVVEEKGPFLENQIKAILFADALRPNVWGKTGPAGEALFAATGELVPEAIAASLGGLLATVTGDSEVERRARARAALVKEAGAFAVAPQLRKPFFCSGCPHNRSTVVPEGSRALAGIGCHGLAAYNRPRTGSFSQMGGEGVHWMGLSPFTDEAHVFANMGDGTYFHSGLLAIRQAVAARLNITYKLLFNSAVAMTGGQSVDGELSVEGLVAQLKAEGVRHIALVSDAPERFPAGGDVRQSIDLLVHRDELDAVQEELRRAPGVSVIVYDQMCATEKRRLRKRKRLSDPDRRIFINDRVCEGCGDCSAKSNCLSVEPIETPLGTKRRINQSSCNKDYSCVEGFCPSFVSVSGAKPRAGEAVLPKSAGPLPEPGPGERTRQRVLVAGVGGTGVVTIGALLAMSVHLRGGRAGVLDQVGMAQKGGAVASHIHLVRGDANGQAARIDALRIPAGEADLVLACDAVVGNSKDVMAAIESGRTRVLANSDVSITGDFTQDRAAAPDGRLLARRLAERAGDGFVAHPFSSLAQRLLGDAIAANLMMVGFAFQKGWLDLDRAALLEAIRLNGQAVALNESAFDWGRRLAHDAEAVETLAGLRAPPPESLDERIARYRDFLTAYQNEAYAGRFEQEIAAVRSAEAGCGGGTAFTRAAADGLFRLMAYKDEYEVARLFTDGAFAAALAGEFGEKARITFHMAPPILARKGADGRPRKRAFGPWMLPLLRVLAKLKFLRGTAFDPFGWSGERRAERALLNDYIDLLKRLSGSLDERGATEAARIANLVQEVRGYGHVKEAAMARYRREVEAALAMPRTDTATKDIAA